MGKTSVFVAKIYVPVAEKSKTNNSVVLEPTSLTTQYTLVITDLYVTEKWGCVHLRIFRDVEALRRFCYYKTI
jgi:hypothetical protein